MNNKPIVKNSIYNMLYKGFSVLFPIVTMSYISNVLMAERIGRVEYARTIVSYFSLAAALGIPNYGIKSIAQFRDDITQRSKAFWELFYINAISTIICTVLYYLMVSSITYFYDRRLLFYVTGFTVVLNAISIDWYYQGVEEFKYITIRSIVIKLVSFLLMLLFVKSRNDYIIYAGILCFATAGNNIFNIIHLRKQIEFFGIRECELCKHLKPVMILLGATLATEIYTMLDTIILEYIHGEIYVGYYQNCVKIVRMVYTMTIAMVATFYPRISYYVKQGLINESNDLLSKGIKTLLLISVPSSVGIFLISDSMIPVLLGKSFYPSVNCLQIVSILIIIFSIAYLLGHIVLMASGNERKILLATICGAIINALLNILLIPNFFHYGAAIASVIAELVVTAILVYNAKSYYKININKEYIHSSVLSLFLMIVYILLIKCVGFSDILELAICIIGAVIIYGGSLILLKNEIARGVLDIFLNKIRGNNE